uniref:Uncharacterized protein n=1 Tax=Lygus hesperus TaxID=30085 RepID=A0A0K8SW93_LYGHE
MNSDTIITANRALSTLLPAISARARLGGFFVCSSPINTPDKVRFSALDIPTKRRRRPPFEHSLLGLKLNSLGRCGSWRLAKSLLLMAEKKNLTHKTRRENVGASQP